jgi:spore maturation protein CgeB
MGQYYPMELVPRKIEYHNIFSKAKFKSVLEFCLSKDHGSDVKLVEQLLVGTLAAVELDCIADLDNQELEAELVSQHYLDYVEITNEVIRDSKTDRVDVREFVDRISKHCHAKSGQESFL